ncbi:2,3-bisphosphoglycerate-independent phosphoglycerate mutase [Metamycoplasma orale]|uniref:2,3-bisphosphoglycerate-independent phosphoglycerate mutase n=1 Tax=Metamycoplasma orale TaxID=2121 RepID=A0A448ZXM1_METOS|nr:2,3-bisphosphoglycerate-independent phosphoglycerate mutase [Metamycoplasma orale]VEU55992.1 phosphoglyceromutase [Metamycoplasma orale]
MKKKIILTIIDGLGIRKETQGNAYALAKHPTFDYLFSNCPHSILEASGKYVGLPEGQIGNSEVGHLNIGAGRIVYTGLSLINKQIEDKTFFKNEVLKKVMLDCKAKNTVLHLMGMLSNGGVHSHEEHLFALIEMAHELKLTKVSVHIFGDGRDVKPQSILPSIEKLESLVKKYGYTISSIAGRFYAMDRDQIFERNEQAFLCLLGKSKNKFDDLKKYVQDQYDQQIYDEFIIPAQNKNGLFVKDNDSIIFFNFRPDRARQLSHLFIGSNDLYSYQSSNKVKINQFVSFMNYEKIPSLVAFKEMEIINPIGKVLEQNNLKQLRLAETQKYAHVTFFMDGGKEENYKGQKRILVDSIKAASFADCPQMSAKEITDELLSNIKDFDFVIMNYANPDMVGHTGNLKATIQAIEFLDKQFKRILDYVSKNKDSINWFITADHGNAEIVEDQNGKPVTKHTTSPVMLISYDNSIKLQNGILADVAPTVLDYANIKKPKEMTGKSLIIK